MSPHLVASATPPPHEQPLQHPTPHTPEATRRRTATDDLDLADLPEWTTMTPADVSKLPEETAKEMLNKAIALSRSLQSSLRQLQLSEAHQRFSRSMEKAEREERSKRQEVEDHIVASEKHLLLNRISQSDEETFRQRHKRAKRRLMELAEDNKRQQHSMDHLQRQLRDLSRYDDRSTDLLPGHRADGGLDVLSDAAIQMRELHESSNESSQRSPSRQLMSPVAFSTTPDMQRLTSPPTRSAKRKVSYGSTITELEQETPEKEQRGRRLTFNSSSTAADSKFGKHQDSGPPTPFSPPQHRRRLAPSAMS